VISFSTETTEDPEIFDILSSQKAVSAGQILNSLSDNPADRTLRDDLAKLKKLGLIETTGKGRGVVWFLAQNKAAFCLIVA